MPVRKTSIDVFRQIEAEGLLSARRMEVYRILFEHGPMTTNEVFQHARLHGNPNYRHNSHARMSELRELGVVEELGTKECSATGRTAILWDVTDSLPSGTVSSSPARPSRERMREAIEETRELYAAWRAQGGDHKKALAEVMVWLGTKAAPKPPASEV